MVLATLRGDRLTRTIHLPFLILEVATVIGSSCASGADFMNFAASDAETGNPVPFTSASAPADDWQGGNFNLGQMRGIVGYALNETNEVGAWGVSHTDVARIGGSPAFSKVRASDQANLYWRHQFGSCGSTLAYAGGPSSCNQAGWIFGLNGQAPLKNKLSLYGNFAFAPPKFGAGSFGADSLEWDVAFGVRYSLGGKAASATVSGQRDLPLLPVANNATMLITR